MDSKNIIKKSGSKDAIKKPTPELEKNDGKVAFNSHQISLQNYCLPKPIINYIREAANGKVLRKFYRTCKYFYQKNPYCIIDEIEEEKIKIDDKWFAVPELQMIDKLWILNSIQMPDSNNIKLLDKMIRCDATLIHLQTDELSKNVYEILTKNSKNIKVLGLLPATINSANENEKYMSVEELLKRFPNAIAISGMVKGKFDLNLIEPRRDDTHELDLIIKMAKDNNQELHHLKANGSMDFKKKICNKISILDFYIVDNDFNPDEYFKLFEKVLASNANVRLVFKCSNQEVAEICQRKCIKLKNDLKTKWKPEAEKPKLFLEIYAR